MRRQRTSGILAVLGALLVVVLGATAAAAQAPEKETFQVDETFPYPILTEACGVEVTITFTGRVTFFTFPDRPVGPQELTTVNLETIATADGNQVRTMNAGIDLVKVQPDGTVILSVVGHVPFEFNGVLKINVETGEVILEPHPIDLRGVCEALTA